MQGDARPSFPSQVGPRDYPAQAPRSPCYGTLEILLASSGCLRAVSPPIDIDAVLAPIVAVPSPSLGPGRRADHRQSPYTPRTVQRAALQPVHGPRRGPGMRAARATPPDSPGRADRQLWTSVW